MAPGFTAEFLPLAEFEAVGGGSGGCRVFSTSPTTQHYIKRKFMQKLFC
jgi:hypothetical protein